MIQKGFGLLRQALGFSINMASKSPSIQKARQKAVKKVRITAQDLFSRLFTAIFLKKNAENLELKDMYG